MRTRPQIGNSFLEFTFVGIPLIFVLISIFEMSRAMWVYTTLAHAAKQGTRYTIVHGENCVTAPNQCQVTIANISAVIRDAGVGLIPADLNVQIRSMSGVNVISGSTVSGPLSTLLTNNTAWPTGMGAQEGIDVEIRLNYAFRSALAFFWTGTRGFTFGTFNLGASSRDRIMF